ncbi:DUF4232 domain-containing protein [Streptomyces sp. NBS 14/10]|uniref:DUF4232 domain-containing protein n=1 Tax=Streptomyces sp. NBS 14/10 TaxID=1945643 RepID=UPI000B7F8E70|nr:DUF4232 domain-containing protein [Streptomyces sp. NBS 14/10]KAK1185478.1 DUF4232 domain-containing protein [Streptomyces sp. NBS 14/10]NUS84428.1 DUF4232 domain-containing protein [Streptomyces sp.]
MSSVRDTRTRLLTATAAVAIAALSLTACGDGSGESDEGPSAGGSSTGSLSGSSSGKGAKPGGAGASGNKVVACKSSSIKTVASPVNRPVNHMLLTVTNTGSAPCDLYGYPAARFGEAQSVPRVNEDSKPQAVVTLAPDESGYAAVNLSATDGSGTNGHTVKSLAITFQDRAGENTSWVAHPSLPAEGVYVDDSLGVTYWQQSMDNALSW